MRENVEEQTVAKRVASGWNNLSEEVVEVWLVRDFKGRPGNTWLGVFGGECVSCVVEEMVERKAS